MLHALDQWRRHHGSSILSVSTAVHLLREGASVILLSERGLASEATGRSS